MKIKPRTISAFHKWCETHKMSEKFIWAGQPIKGSDFKKLLDGDDVKPAPKPAEAVNIDIQEEQHADMGEPLDSRDSEEY